MSANVNIESNDMSNMPTPSAIAGTEVAARVRPFYWSLRREIWENRSIYVAPLAVAGLILFAAIVALIRAPQDAIPFHRMGDVSAEYFRLAGISLYLLIAATLAATAAIVGWFYCLDALSGERRDRSILFWRSLPVSDTTTVLSKVVVGMLVVPLAALIVGIALFAVLLVLSSIVLMSNNVSASLLVSNVDVGEIIAVHMYASVCAILWGAPLYAWAVFVSSWAKRATFLWALMPPAAIALVEGLAFTTQHFMTLVGTRFSGGLRYAFIEDAQALNPGDGDLHPEHIPESLFALLDPVRFASQPGLWIGLAVAAVLIAASIWMRRYREPL